MTSAVGGVRGSPKSRRKEQNQLICDREEGVKKSENFADVIDGSPQRALGDLGMRQDEDMSELAEE